MYRRQSHNNRERGQAAVEFVIVLPLLLMVLFAIVQFGVAFRDYLALTDAVRAGARKGAVSRSDPDPTFVTINAVENAAADLGDGLEVDVDSTWEPGTDVEVTASYPFTIKLLWFIPLTEGRLESSTRERVE